VNEAQIQKLTVARLRELAIHPAADDVQSCAGLWWLYERIQRARRNSVVAEAEEADLREHWSAVVAAHGADRMEGLLDWSSHHWPTLRRLAEGPRSYRIRVSRVVYADIELQALGRRAAEAAAEALVADPAWEPAGGWQGSWKIAGCA
jgi:hypothetical protein